MSFRTNITLFGLLCAGLLQGCVDEAVVGTSGQINIDLAQATLGEFAYDSSTVVAHVNDDGTGDLIVWSNAAQPVAVHADDPPTPPIGIFVFFGGPARFDTSLGPEDADITLTLLPDEFVARVVAQDLDGDGRVELLVHTAHEDSDFFHPMPMALLPSRPGAGAGGLYVVHSAALTVGTHPLAVVGQRTPAYAFGSEYVVHSPYAYRDLDGVSGQEFLTEPYRLADIGSAAINVRAVASGETRARLLAPENVYLDVRGVLDHDGDGASDVAVLYVQTNGLNPNYELSWEDVGVGIFYGPLTGDITLDDDGTVRLPLYGATLVPDVMRAFVIEGAARTVVGDFGGPTEDILLTAYGSQRYVVRVGGGSRDEAALLAQFKIEQLQVDVLDASWTLTTRSPGEGPSQLFVMGSNAFAFLTLGFGPNSAPGDNLEEVVNRAELSYDMPEDSPLFTSLGGAMGDLDGDGVLDLALGTKARELQRGSFVHVVYGFGG